VDFPDAPLLDQHKDLLRRAYGVDGDENFLRVLGRTEAKPRNVRQRLDGKAESSE
jgi:hypothetical protein